MPETKHEPGTPAASPAHDEHFLNSYWPFWVAVGTFFLYLGILYPKVGLPLGVLITFVAVAKWVQMDLHNWHRLHQPQHLHEETGQPGGFWGMALFIGTEIVLFGSLFAFWFIAKNHALEIGSWPPSDLPELPIAATLINTAILVSSGATLHWGMMRLRKGLFKQYLVGLALTILLGAIFLFGQVREYLALIHEGLTIRTHAFGGIFYTLTGTHGAHVFGGLVFLTVVLVRSLAKTQSRERHLALEASAMYWHFVDVVWIFLVAVIYLQLL